MGWECSFTEYGGPGKLLPSKEKGFLIANRWSPPPPSPQAYILESFPGVLSKAELNITSDREWLDTQVRILGPPPPL